MAGPKSVTRGMMQIPWLYGLPLWLTGMVMLGLFLTAVETGFRAGRRVCRNDIDRAGVTRSDVTVNAMLALLGLLLAFTYGFSLSRYDHRKDAAAAEVNAIQAAWLRADLLPEPGRTALRRKLLDYARTRVFSVAMTGTREKIRRALERTAAAKAELWPATLEAVTGGVGAPVAITVTTAVSAVIEAHTRRVTAGFDMIPAAVLVLLVLVSVLALGLAAYNAAVQGIGSRWRMMMFAAVLAAVIVIIMDFDTPLRGSIRGKAAAMTGLIAEMEASL